MLKVLSTFVLSLLAFAGNAQNVYFHQDFGQTTGLINPQPDTGQFSHVILTAPALSFYKFHKGYMELTRSRQDSATGGIIRAMRAAPFEPVPETLVIRISFTVQNVRSPASNAMYFYVGEDFNPVNNSFPGNGLMFAKCSLNFLEDGFNVRDLETQQVSSDYAAKTKVVLTWVLNNSDKLLPYRIGAKGQEEAAPPGSYDLWVDDRAVCKGSKAYPGTSGYSPAKLSNFEMRFRNGVGEIRIDDIRIDDGQPGSVLNEAIVAPNPAGRERIVLAGTGVKAASVRLIGSNGAILPVKTVAEKHGLLSVMPLSPPAGGMHILQWEGQDGRKHSSKVMIE